MADLTCPVCSTPLRLAGFTHRCATCKGAWLAEDVVVGMLEERVATLVELPWEPRTGTARACAECREPMQTVTLGEVALDRCGAAHGIWFDDTELTTLLGEAKQFAKPVEHHGSLLDALKNIFKRG